MFAGTWDRSMKIWNPGSSLTGVDFSGHARPITAVAWLSTGDLVTASRDQILLLWDSESGERLGAMVGHTNAVHCVAETAAGVVVSGGRDKSLRVLARGCLRAAAAVGYVQIGMCAGDRGAGVR